MDTPQYTAKDVARFWSRVDKTSSATGCWIWQGGRHKATNYGFIYICSYGTERQVGAHRLSYSMAFGDMPPDKPLVCHKCDNPPCVNPDHLFAGSAKDNARDMMKKGRGATGAKSGMNTHPEKRRYGNDNGSRKYPERLSRGTNRYNAKLSEGKVNEIRRLLRQGAHHRVIAKQFGVSYGLIGLIAVKKAWKHVVDENP